MLKFPKYATQIFGLKMTPPPFGTFPKIHPIWRSHPSLKALNTQNDKSFYLKYFYLKYVRENLLQSICTKLCNLNAVTDICQFYSLWSFPTSSKPSSKASLTFTSFSCFIDLHILLMFHLAIIFFTTFVLLINFFWNKEWEKASCKATRSKNRNKPREPARV